MSNAKDKVIEAAKFLVEVKDHKDKHGKDLWYRISQPIAWRKLKEALSQLKDQP